MGTNKDFIFVFEKSPGWKKDGHPSAAANSLREATAEDPSLADLKLIEVWRLPTCNMIWSSETGPAWVDC
jgi:hypothetical protein